MDWEHIKAAKVRLEEIKTEIKALQEQSKEIVEWLDSELVINKLDYKTQTFEGEGIKVKAKVPQNFKVNEDALIKVTTENDAFQEIASQLFHWDCKVTEGAWNKATDELKELFAPAVTVTPGKTQYEFSLIED